MYSFRPLFPSLLFLSLAACGGSSDDLNPEDAALLEGADVAPASVEAASASSTSEGHVPEIAEEVVLSNDGVAVGSTVGVDGAISAKKPTYAPDDVVHAAVAVAGHSGKEAAIFWFDSTGISIKGERKPIPAGAKFVNFSLSKADGMKPGSYTAQIDIDDTPVGMADFTVK